MTAQPIAPAAVADWDHIHRARCDLAAQVEAERFRQECLDDRADFDDYDMGDDEL